MPRSVGNLISRGFRWLKWGRLPGIVVLTTVVGFRTSAEMADYLIDVWTSEHGLPNSSVTAIAQTPDGYLWVGTYNGLARFDGVRFVRFDPDNTPALRRARVRRLYVDSGGTLWINTYDGSLTSYRDRCFTLEWEGSGSADATVRLVSTRSNRPVFLLHTGELIRHQPGMVGTNRWEILRPPGASSGQICAEEGDGAIWCRGRDQRLWRLVGDTFEEVSTNSGLQGRVINVLTADAQGRIWVGTDRELAVWEEGCFVSRTPTNGEAILNVAYLHLTQGGDAWVLANDRVRKARDRDWQFEAEECRRVFTGWQDRLGMHEDRHGEVWLYHYGKGIFHIRPKGRTRELARAENFPGARVDCFLEDQEGNLWAGVDRGGLVRIRKRYFKVLSPDDAPKAAVTVTEDPQGAVWVGTFGGGLHRWFADSWERFSLPDGSRRGFVFSVFPDAQDRLWVSAGQEDLFLRKRDVFEPILPTIHGVKVLLAGRDGRLWIGTKSGLGCLENGQFRQFQERDGVRRTDVRALAEDSSGTVWAGAGDETLYRFRSNRVDAFRPEDSPVSHPIWSLLADADGSIWAGTFRGGLLRFRDGQFVRFSRKEGLPDDVICQLLEDEKGSLWIGSQQGIFRVAKSELDDFARGRRKTINCTAYGRYDGLPSLECSGGYQPAAWRTRDGRLLFTTLKGVVSVQPDELSPNQMPPHVVIEEVLLDGRTQRLEPGVKNASDEWRVTSDVKFTRGRLVTRHSSPVTLPVLPGKRQIEVRYTALSFVSPDRVRFRYKLSGLDEDWIEAGTRRFAQYSFLRPGDYQFQVAACNNDGVWNTLGSTLSLQVMPYFYQTWWFLSLTGVLATVAVAATVRQFVVRGMRRELEKLDRQRAVERDRARIARDIHDDLGAGLTHITLLSELARRSQPRDVPDHLNHISDMARELTRAMDETVWALNPQNDSLEGLMTYVTKYAQDYLNVAGIRCRLDLPAQLPPYGLSAEVRHNLYFAVKETLNNVVKHARASEAWLRLSLRPDGFNLVIEDDGCGLNGDTRTEATPNGRLHSGNGLGILDERLSSAGGLCVVSSKPGRGTRVEFNVKLPESS